MRKCKSWVIVSNVINAELEALQRHSLTRPKSFDIIAAIASINTGLKTSSLQGSRSTASFL